MCSKVKLVKKECTGSDILEYKLDLLFFFFSFLEGNFCCERPKVLYVSGFRLLISCRCMLSLNSR